MNLSLPNQPTFLVKPNQNGYIAVVTVLVIVAVLTIIVLTVSLSSLNDTQSSFYGSRGNNARGLLEACVQESLYQLNTKNTLPTSVTVPTGSCSVTTNLLNGNYSTFTVSTTLNTFTKSVQVVAYRFNNVVIQSWIEL